MTVLKTMTATFLAAIGLFFSGCSGTIYDPDTVTPYADESGIIDAASLNTFINDTSLLLLDARGAEYADSEHIPGAVAVSWQQFTAIRPGVPGLGFVPGPTQLSPLLSSIGITEGKTIVVYSNSISGWGEDGWIAWILKMARIDDVKILNGGFSYWKSIGNEVTKSKTPLPQTTSFSISSFDSAYTITKSELSAGLGTIKIIDARDISEYNGAQNYGEPRGGHIPGAVSINFRKVFQANGLIQGQNELAEMFTSAGIHRNDQISVYCTEGVRSAHLVMILRIAGYSKARNFDGSFYEWAADTTLPVVK